MITMMEHPKHGRHPATGHEVEHLKSLGWTILQPKSKKDEAMKIGDEHLSLIKAAIVNDLPPPRQKRAYNRRQA